VSKAGQLRRPPDARPYCPQSQFFDFGNVEQVAMVLEYLAALGLEPTATAAEVVLLRPAGRRASACWRPAWWETGKISIGWAGLGGLYQLRLHVYH
jgi:hypothetical protein